MNTMHFVVVDVETTGLLPEENEIIEIGMVKILGMKVVDEYSSLVKPTRSIPPAVTSLTGISNKTVADAPAFADIAGDVAAFIGDAILIGHNIDFDHSMLIRSFARQGYRFPPAKTIDTILLYSILNPTEKNYKLQHIVKAMLQDPSHLHRAIIDAQMTARIFLGVLEEFRELSPALLRLFWVMLSYSDSPLFRIVDSIASEQSIPPAEIGDIYPLLLSLCQEQAHHITVPRKPAGQAEIIRSLLRETRDCSEVPAIFQTVQETFSDLSGVMMAATYDQVFYVTAIAAAIHWSLANKTPVSVCLQNDEEIAYVLNDILPVLARTGKLPVSIVTFKDNPSHICLHKLHRRIEAACRHKSGEELVELLPVLTWIAATQDGCMEELHTKISQRFQKKLTVLAEQCSDASCSACFVQKRFASGNTGQLILHTQASLFTPDELLKQLLSPAGRTIVFHSEIALRRAAEYLSLTFSQKPVTRMHFLLYDYDPSRSQAPEAFTPDVTEEFPLLTLFRETVTRLRTELAHVFSELAKIPGRSAGYRVLNINGKKLPGHQEIADQLILIRSIAAESKEFAEKLLQAIDTRQLPENKALARRIPGYVGSLFSLIRIIDTYHADTEENIVVWADITHKMLESSSYLSPLSDTPFRHLLLTVPTEVATDDDLSRYIAMESGMPFLPSGESPKNKQEDQLPRFVSVMKNNLPAGYKNRIQSHVRILTEIAHTSPGRYLVVADRERYMTGISDAIKKKLKSTSYSIITERPEATRQSTLRKFLRSRQAFLFTTYESAESYCIAQPSTFNIILLTLPPFSVNEPVHRARIEAMKQQNINWLQSYVIPFRVTWLKSLLARLLRNNSKNSAIIDLTSESRTRSYGQRFIFSGLWHTIYIDTIKQLTDLINHDR